MAPRVVIIGAGYGGLAAARRLAGAADITVVSSSAQFIERVRLHELAAGGPVPARPLPRLRGVTWVTATVADIDRAGHGVVLDEGSLPYDLLVLAAGSTARVPDIAGAGLGATVGDWSGAQELRDRVRRLPAGAHVTVVGAGLTGVEAAAELAESCPSLRVRLVSAAATGAWLSVRAAGRLRDGLARVGVELHEGVRVGAVADDEIATTTGALPSALTVWATGFSPTPLAARAGLALAADGRALVDRHLVSVTDPDIVVVGTRRCPSRPRCRFGCRARRRSRWAGRPGVRSAPCCVARSRRSSACATSGPTPAWAAGTGSHRSPAPTTGPPRSGGVGSRLPGSKRRSPVRPPG